MNVIVLHFSFLILICSPFACSVLSSVIIDSAPARVASPSGGTKRGGAAAGKKKESEEKEVRSCHHYLLIFLFLLLIPVVCSLLPCVFLWPVLFLRPFLIFVSALSFLLLDFFSPACFPLSLQVGSWVEMFSPEGVPYYFNRSTNETTWDKPEELKTAKEKDKAVSGSTRLRDLLSINVIVLFFCLLALRFDSCLLDCVG